MLSSSANVNDGAPNVIPFEFEIGMLVKENCGPKSRHGIIKKITKCYITVTTQNGKSFRRMKKNIQPTTMEELAASTSRFDYNKTIVVGCVIECVSGSNVGKKGMVVKVCPKMHVFELGNNKKHRVAKKNAVALVCDADIVSTTGDGVGIERPKKRARSLLFAMASQPLLWSRTSY